MKAAIASSDVEHKAETKKKAVPRKAAGQSWEDPILAEWPEGMIRFSSWKFGRERLFVISQFGFVEPI